MSDRTVKLLSDIRLKSAFVPPASQDGSRYLVETFWPEGLDVYTLWPYQWFREIAPSYELSQKVDWEKWDKDRFRKEYWTELSQPERKIWIEKIKVKTQEGIVTFLYSSRSSRDSTATLLKEFLLNQ